MNPDIEPVILANSKFSIDLLKKLCKAKPEENVSFSPLSISSAMGLVTLGAKNNTLEEMKKVLHFGDMDIMYHYLYEELYKEGEYKNKVPGQEKTRRSLQLVNRLFGDQTIKFNDDFLDECEEWCFGSLRTVDFKTNPEAAREQINDWVEKKTDENMADLLGPGDVSKDTSLALISAIYFERKWAKAFSRKDKGVNWPVMGKEDTLLLGTVPHRQHKCSTESSGKGLGEPEAQILEIPYEYGHLSMFVILPNEGTDLQKLIDSITYEKILEWTEPDNMIPTKVSVEMPVFTLQEKYDLEKPLKDLGIKDLFSDKCDLSGMAPGKLKLSKILHKCFIDVNENGTGAVGGSGAVVKTLQSQKIDESFIVKPPFLFFIRHNSTKSILFWGRVIKPKPEN